MVPEPTYVANLEIVNWARNTKGAVVECGTWKGGMIAGIAACLGPDRDYFLFDSFEGLPKAKNVDGESAMEWQQNTKGPYYYDNCTASEGHAREAMNRAGISHAHLIKGWFRDTLPGRHFPNGIAILRMDGDWYESTMQILDNLFGFVNKNGLVIVDDYYVWDGCSKAVHDFLSRRQLPERIESHRAVCFIKRRTGSLQN
jgi:O-methyltransferase